MAFIPSYNIDYSKKLDLQRWCVKADERHNGLYHYSNKDIRYLNASKIWDYEIEISQKYILIWETLQNTQCNQGNVRNSFSKQLFLEDRNYVW